MLKSFHWDEKPGMNKQILCVDDEESILSAMRRSLHKYFDVSTALGSALGLQALQGAEKFAVIVVDMNMPGMNGIDFLKEAQRLSPDSVRIMLTGNSDQRTAMAAVNSGEVFRFLTKPCEAETLRKVLALGVRQYQLITAEKELLNRTLKGGVEALCEILSVTKPLAFGRVERLRGKCQEVAREIGDVTSWQLNTAVFLSQLGCINVSEGILEKVSRGETLNREETKEYLDHPKKGAELIQKIPRLESIAKIVAYQHKNFDGSGVPFNECKGEDIPIEARILNVVIAFDDRKNADWSDAAAYEYLNEQQEKYDPKVLKALSNCISLSEKITIRVELDQLRNNMIIEEDIFSVENTLLICRGTKVTQIIREHLIAFKKNGMLNQKVLVTG